MGLFSRRGAAEPDPALTMFDRPTADRFRAEVGRTVAELGRPGEVRTDLVLVDGTEYGLWNLAATCADEGRTPRKWRAAIRDHFARAFAAMDRPDPLAGGLDQIRDRLILRLVDLDTVPQWFDYAPEFLPGVHAVVTVDLPDSVHQITTDDLAALGPVPELVELARANLLTHFRTEQFQLGEISRDGAGFHVLTGESMFTASLAVFLPEVVDRFVPRADLSEGIVFGVPYRHQLVIAAAQPAQRAMNALTSMPPYVATVHADSAGPISPHTFYWRDGEITRLTTLDDDGLRLQSGPDLQRVLDTLAP